MEKNIIVTDVNGNEIGRTFPKRAKGLVKSGRAEYLNDCGIRLLFTHASAVNISNKFTEENSMSKIIEFNARDYHADKECQSNAAERMFVSTALGSREVWEVGDLSNNRSQIFCEKTLEPNTDYTFRFAVTGGYRKGGKAFVSRVCLYHTDGYETPEEAWEDKMTFSLENNKFAPIICKKDNTDIIRVFELPFNTGDYTNWKIVFVAQNVHASFMCAGELSAYEKLPDITHDDPENRQNDTEGENKISSKKLSEEKFLWMLNSLSYGSEFNYSKVIVEHLSEAPSTAPQISFSANAAKFRFNEAILTPLAATALMAKIGDRCYVNLDKIVVSDGDIPERMTVGDVADEANISVSNSKLTSLDASALIAKIGAGCTVNLKNVNINELGLNRMVHVGPMGDRFSITLSNVTLPAPVMGKIIKKLGDYCIVQLENVEVVGDDIGKTSERMLRQDGIIFTIKDSSIPNSIINFIHRKMGEDCSLSIDDMLA